jgi:hypothetical protein
MVQYELDAVILLIVIAILVLPVSFGSRQRRGKTGNQDKPLP